MSRIEIDPISSNSAARFLADFLLGEIYLPILSKSFDLAQLVHRRITLTQNSAARLFALAEVTGGHCFRKVPFQYHTA